MSADQRDILDVLKSELSFLENGGYSRTLETPWKPTSIFQHSASCINRNDPQRSRPCGECLLTDFVPVRSLREDVPCHHIPLNAHGETVYTMERQYTQPELEEALRGWLRATIQRLEREETPREQAEA
jgi:hypothetical protein